VRRGTFLEVFLQEGHIAQAKEVSFGFNRGDLEDIYSFMHFPYMEQLLFTFFGVFLLQ
jgi:hypothetical protein